MWLSVSTTDHKASYNVTPIKLALGKSFTSDALSNYTTTVEIVPYLTAFSILFWLQELVYIWKHYISAKALVKSEDESLWLVHFMYGAK